MTSLATDYSTLSAHLLAWACRFLIQSTLLIALALTACALLRHRSAALRSSILRAALLAVIICPFLPSLGGPAALHVPIPGAVPAIMNPPGLSPSSSLPKPPVRFALPISKTPPPGTEPAKPRLPILYATLSL